MACNTEEAEAIPGTATAAGRAEVLTLELAAGKRSVTTDKDAIIQCLARRLCCVLASRGAYINLYRHGGGFRIVQALKDVAVNASLHPPLVTVETDGKKLPAEVEAAVETALQAFSEAELFVLKDLMSARCDYPNERMLCIKGVIPPNNKASAYWRCR